MKLWINNTWEVYNIKGPILYGKLMMLWINNISEVYDIMGPILYGK